MDTTQPHAENTSLAVYVHIPFCTKHCAYCDFNTYVEKAQSGIVEATVDAICRDIEQTAVANPAMAVRTVPTIFFGGGTPTFLSGEQLARILRAIYSSFNVDPAAEISSEANPGTSDAGRFAIMREVGFNRLSIGVQSFDDEILVALDRFHTGGEATAALRSARTAGFENINLDLMFGLPKQGIEHWLASLHRAVDQNVEHLSLYALTLEPGTRFERLHAGGKLGLPDEDTEAEMYERCIETLVEAGYEHYEVSNFARPGFRCRHNLTYWRNEEYIGFGPGAVSYFQRRRWKRERLPKRYIDKVVAGADLAVESECLEPEAALGETMMLGLRLREGMPLQPVRERFGRDPLVVYAETIRRLAREGLLHVDPHRLTLTHAGLLLANTVVSEFLAV
jgi:oxygen-independent coproporphyrinogen-3 oxidase